MAGKQKETVDAVKKTVWQGEGPLLFGKTSIKKGESIPESVLDAMDPERVANFKKDKLIEETLVEDGKE